MIKRILCSSQIQFLLELVDWLTHVNFPDLSVIKLQGHSAISEAVTQADHKTIHWNIWPEKWPTPRILQKETNLKFFIIPSPWAHVYGR